MISKVCCEETLKVCTWASRGRTVWYIETDNFVNVPLRIAIASNDFGHDFQFEDSEMNTQISLVEVSSD
jgi:hypothetical protein